MKKFFQPLILSIALLGTGTLATSCDSDSPWFSILTNVLEGMLNQSGGTTQAYSGTGTLAMYDYNTGNNTYNPNSKVESQLDLKPTLTVSVSDSVVTVTLGALTLGGTTVTDFTFNTYCWDNQIDPKGPTYLTGATCTYNGKANTAVNAACIQGAYTAEKLNLTNIYFQVEGKVFMGSFSGAAVTN